MMSVDLSLLIAQLVTFLIGMALLWRLAYRPLARVARERRERIAGDLNTAAESRRAGEQARQALEARLAALAEESRALRQQAAREAQVERDRILQDARREREALAQRGEESLALAAEQARRAVRRDAADLALRVASAVIGSAAADPAVQRRLAEEALAALEREAPP